MTMNMMNHSTRFSELLLWEWRRVARSRLLWSAIALVFLSFIWGASTAARLHHAQSDMQQRTLAYQAERHADTVARAEHFKQIGAELPYWQDPTGVAGYSQYFMLQSAIKPHLPLSALAIGGSDLQPSVLPVKLNTLFGIEPVYDFENPRGLALGGFDLAFAAVYLLPLIIISVVCLLSTFERDRGLLRLIAAQPVSPRYWLGARTLAITVWLLPAIAIALPLALSASGASIQQAIGELITAIVLLIAYATVWIALAFAVLAGWPSAAGAMSALVSCWLTLALAAPILADAAIAVIAPAPSRAVYINDQRQIVRAMTEHREQILTDMFKARSDLINATAQIPNLDSVSRNTFFTAEIEMRLAPLQSQFDTVRTIHARASQTAGYVALPLGVLQALTVLAGTDATRHLAFEAQIRTHQLRLREWFYPLIQREISTPTPKPIPGSMGRFNFTQFDKVPTMHFVDSTGNERINNVIPMVLWLFALGAVLLAVGYKRLRCWPADL